MKEAGTWYDPDVRRQTSGWAMLAGLVAIACATPRPAPQPTPVATPTPVAVPTAHPTASALATAQPPSEPVSTCKPIPPGTASDDESPAIGGTKRNVIL